MFQEISSSAGRCREGGLGMVGRGSGFTLALLIFQPSLFNT